MPIRGMFLSALAEIRVGKVRVLLSAFCVACLVATVTVVATVGGVTQQVARTLFEQQTGRPGTMTLHPEYGKMAAGGVPSESVQAIKDSLERFGIVHAPRFEFGEAQIRTADRRVLKTQPQNGPPDFMLTVTDHRLAEIEYLPMTAGRWFNATDETRLEPVIVVTGGFVQKAGLDPREAIGSRVEFAAGEVWQKARIVGITGAKSSMMMMGPDGEIPVVYLPYSSMRNMGILTQQPVFKIRVAPEHGDETITRLKAESSKWGVHQLHVEKSGGNFVVIGGKLRLLLVGVTVAMLLLGSLPVIALGIFAVRQRRSEFGVHRCFGATGSDLFLTVLLEGLIVCFAAGLAGVSAGYLVQGPAMGILIEQYFGVEGQGIDTSFPWEAALLGLGVAVCVGVFTGLIPAWRAMQKSVIRAIRA